MLVTACLSVGYLTVMTVLSCSTPSPPLPDRELLDTTASTTPDESAPEAGAGDAGDGAYEVNTGPCPGYCGCPGTCGVNGTSGDYGKAGGVVGNTLR